MPIELATLALGAAFVGHRARRALADLDALDLVPGMVATLCAALVVEVALLWAVSP